MIALVIAFVVSQGLDKPQCEGDIAPCGAAVVGRSVAVVDGGRNDAPFPPMERYRDDASGFSFEYDPSIWSVQQQDAGFVLLSAFNGALAYIVEAAPAENFEVQELFNARRDLLSQRLLGFQLDREPARLLIGNAILGHRKGIGALFGGTIDSPQGPSTDFAVAEVAATDGRIVAVATILTPAQVREGGLSLADSINNTFTWPNDPVVE